MTVEYGQYEWAFDFDAWRKLWRANRENDAIAAELLDVNVGTIQAWRTKTGRLPHETPRMENLLKACNLFEIDPGAFFVLKRKA